MLFVLTAVAVLIVAGVVLLIARDRPILDQDETQRPQDWPPADPVGPQDIQSARFEVVVRGYRMEQVDRVLSDAAAALAQRDAEIARLSAGMAVQRAGTEAQGPHEPAADEG